MAIAAPTAAQVAEAVIRIRRRKLPDPAVLGNAGSFFKNPIVPVAQAEALSAANQRLPVFPVAAFPADATTHGEAGGDLRKLSAAWLIDACGWKDRKSVVQGKSGSVRVDLGGRRSLKKKKKKKNQNIRKQQQQKQTSS